MEVQLSLDCDRRLKRDDLVAIRIDDWCGDDCEVDCKLALWLDPISVLWAINTWLSKALECNKSQPHCTTKSCSTAWSNHMSTLWLFNLLNWLRLNFQLPNSCSVLQNWVSLGMIIYRLVDEHGQSWRWTSTQIDSKLLDKLEQSLSNISLNCLQVQDSRIIRACNMLPLFHSTLGVQDVLPLFPHINNPFCRGPHRYGNITIEI